MNADSVRRLDARILELAKYEVSRGGLVKPGIKLINETFRYFKRLIMKNEANIEELDDMVRSTYGDPSHKELTFEDFGWREATVADYKYMPPCEVISNELFSAMN